MTASALCPTCGLTHDRDAPCEAPRDPRIGMLLADRYRITRLIGHGGMGSVYEAQHATIQRRFAIKFLLPEYARNREMLRRFENEARAAGRLEHVNIAAVIDFGHAEDGSPYLVMEYLPGEDCASQLAKGGRFSTVRATNIVYQACMGLSVAHQAGIVHRDIKPENLFILTTAEGEDLVKLLDFGIAKLRNPDASAMTASGTTMGTVYYMSPEQIRDSAKVDEQSDVWALGVLLYELLTNQRPFGGSNVTEVIYEIVHVEPKRIDTVRSGLPSSLVETIHRALAKEPAERIESVDALADALRPFTNRPSLRPAQPTAAVADTVASADGAARRRASTSQLGVTEIPSTPRLRSPRRWVGAVLGLVVLGAAVFGIRMGSAERGTVASRPSPLAASALAESTASALAESTASAPAESAEVPELSEPSEIDQVRTTFGQTKGGPRDTRPSPRTTSTPQAGSAAASDPATPPVAPVSTPPRKPAAAPGSTITIDPHNPF